MQYQNKALASANKDLNAKIKSLQTDLSKKQQEREQVENAIGIFASTLVKVNKCFVNLSFVVGWAITQTDWLTIQIWSELVIFTSDFEHYFFE